jgi:hypothetical protein
MSSRIEQSLSLMIPRVFPQWIDEEKIIDIFHQQHLGRVYKVSIIRMPDSKKRSYPIYQAFIYFSAWYETEIAYNFQQRIFGPRAQARVVYDDPWFWVAFENKKHRLSNNDKRMIRLGYQTYLNEQEMLAQDERIRQLENISVLEQFPKVPERVPPPMPDRPVPVPSTQSETRLNWYLSEDFVMDTLGAEIDLTETAMNVAESVLEENCSVDISDNYIQPTKKWYNAEWTSFYDNQLATAATELLGADLALTETAMSVAESALMESHEEAETELNLTETANSVAEAALDEDEECERYYSSDEEDDDRYYFNRNYHHTLSGYMH